MSDCGVCLTSECDGYTDFIYTAIRKARIAHKCSECRREIQAGEKYEHASGKTDGDLWQFDTCLICAEIADAFYCQGRMFGGVLWEEMSEYAFEKMNTACLGRLKTAAAKSELLRRWNEWKFQQRPPWRKL